MNLASALSMQRHDTENRNLRVGLLDLDIFGPSVPKLMGLEDVGEPLTTESMSFLLFRIRSHKPTPS